MSEPVTTIIGIDCAADWRNIGLARGEYRAGVLVVREVRCRKEQPIDVLRGWLVGCSSAVVALDAPLGWPAPMVRELVAHRAGARLPTTDRQQFFNRTTDVAIRSRFRKKPLEVGANLIAHTAHSAIDLLNRLRDALKVEIPLGWQPGVPEGVVAIEVYPAVTRIGRGIVCEGNTLLQLPTDVSLATEVPAECSVDHVRDAVLCAVAAADFCAGRAIGPVDLALARQEGWIWAAGEAPPLPAKGRRRKP
jgi:predicted nuclease with RNAse H fold